VKDNPDDEEPPMESNPSEPTYAAARPPAARPFLPWVIVAAGGLMGCVAVGAVFALAVFLQPMAADTGWSRAGISGAMTFAFLAMGLAGFGWGALSDRWGPRPVVMIGAVLLGLANVLASRATSLLEFQVLYGVLMGVAAGSFFVPVIANTAAWFDRHRSLAVSLVSAGIGMAPLTISPIVAWLVTHHDWRTTQLIVGVGSWIVLLPATLLIRRAPILAAPAPQARADADAAVATASDGTPEMPVGQALRSRAFIVLALTYFACCATHAGPIFHTVSYAIVCGLPTMAAVTIYSMEGLAGLGGRVLFGLAGDRFGAKPVLVAGLLIQAFGAGAYMLVTHLVGFYTVAFVFGMAYGGVMPLYAVLARDHFSPRILGTVLGAAAMVSSLGMSLGPALGGWLFDRFGSYAPMYAGSFAVGLGAAAIALAFPRAPQTSGPARVAPWRASAAS
jgi:MFS family permease